MSVGTDLEIIPPERSEIAGSDAERQPSLQTTARTDLELLAVWLKSHVDGSEHTIRAYGRIGRRFLDALNAAGTNLRHATLDDVQTALETIRVKLDGAPAKPATVNANVAIVKALLGFAHQVGYTRFNAAPLIKLRKAPRQLAQRIMSEFDTLSILRAAKPGRERILCEVGYYGALRVSEIASLTWSQVLPAGCRFGTGSRVPDHGTAHQLYSESDSEARRQQSRHLFPLAAPCPRLARDRGAPITLVSQTLGHTDLKTTSVYAHARPNESSSRHLKSR